ncbi:MAG: hypothetical protein V1899_09780, partial [Planctomycetota bacterium]
QMTADLKYTARNWPTSVVAQTHAIRAATVRERAILANRRLLTCAARINMRGSHEYVRLMHHVLGN